MRGKPGRLANAERRQPLGEIAVLALLYFGTARLGQLVAIPPGNITPVWIPSGIILAAVLTRGYHVWPGIFLGAFAGNAWAYFSTESFGTVFASLLAGASNGIGDSLGAVVGAYLIRRGTDDRNLLGSVTQTAKVIGYGGAVGAGISAVCGVTGLYVADLLPWSQYGTALRTWWVGDGAGVLLGTPLLLAWARGSGGFRFGREEQAALLCVAAFGLFLAPRPELAFSLAGVSLATWAIIRFDPRVGFAIGPFVAATAVVASACGRGPFFGGTADQNVLRLQECVVALGAPLFLLHAALAERKRSETALASAKAHCQLLLEVAGDGIHVVNQQGDLVEANPAFYRMLGYSPRNPPSLNVADWDSRHSSRELQARIASLMTRPEIFETSYRRQDGKEIDVEINARGVTIDGRMHVYASSRDLSERKREQAKLRQSQGMLASIAEGTSDAVYVKDTQGRYLMANSATARFVGKTVEQILGTDDTALFPPQQARQVMERDHGVMTSGVTQTYEEFLTTNGAELTFLTTKGPTRDAHGDVTGLFGIARDITERERAERKIAGAARDWQNTFDAANDAIWILDAEDRVLRSNKTAERFFHRRCAEMLGEHPWAIVHGTTEAPEECPLKDARRSLRRETRKFSDDGRWLEVSVDPIFAASGEYTGAVHIVSDISERVRGEEDRARLEVQLRRTERLDALGTLAGGIAHDFNNILGAIVGNAELARQDVGRDHPAMESLDEIRKASLRAKDLVQRVLAFASHRQGVLQVIALRPVVEDAISLLHATIPAGVEITATFGADTPTVLADPTQIHQVLINLCTNSWQAMQAHAGRIDIQLDGATLDADASRVSPELSPGHFARLRVADAGCGMDAATLERIFDPFFTTKPVGQGTGLGLSVVHRIVQKHSGVITTSSQPGRGTVFTVYLPAAEAQGQDTVASNAAAADPEIGGKHVLYLDDEESLVFLVRRMLERLGYRVSGYTRPADALAALRADPRQFDLVVTDFNMPGMSGLEVAREISRLRSDLPVVMASGYITDELHAQARQANVRELIYKPDTVEGLCEVVHRFAGLSSRG